MNTLLHKLGDTVGIIGMGVSGQAAQKLFSFVVPDLKVCTYDSKPGAAQWSDLEALLGQNNLTSLVVSPGVALTTSALAKARQKGLLITSEMALAHSFLSTEKLVAVTGSVGKSTTVSLLEKAAQSFDPASLAVGNIGKPLAEYVLEVLKGQRPPAPWLIIELSSFQLENYENLAVEHSIFTYFTANHLERYSSKEEYYRTKWTLAAKTKGFIFVNRQSEELVDFLPPESQKIVFCSPQDPEISSFNLSESLLLGQHNQQNLSLAARFIQQLNWPAGAMEAIKKFPGLPHRLENLGLTKGIRFVNDSKATAMDSVISAVSSLQDSVAKENSLYVLLGGRDKNLPWHELRVLQQFPCIRPLYFGESAEKAAIGLQIPGPRFAKLHLALQDIFSQLQRGDTLLLSPGGTSMDEFRNFEERGEFFRSQIKIWGS